MNIVKNLYAVALLIIVTAIVLPKNVQAELVPARGPIPFAAYDKDGNGLISEAEFNAVRGERIASKSTTGRPMRGLADAPSFSSFDTNGDGQLSRNELTIGQRAQMEKRRGAGMGQGQFVGQGRGKRQGGMGQGRGMGRNMPAFSAYDLNGDGKIVEKEFYEGRMQRMKERAQQGYQMRNLGNAPMFADLDVNGDGEVSAEEFAAHQSQK